MLCRTKLLSALVGLLVFASLADAGRRGQERRQERRQERGRSSCSQSSGYVKSQQSYPMSAPCAAPECNFAGSVSVIESRAEELPAAREIGTSNTQVQPARKRQVPSDVIDGLDEVNAKRRAWGMHPFILHPGLMAAARACVAYRRDHGINGHANDYQFLPPGVTAASSGAEGAGGGGFAWHMAGDPWNTCCQDGNYTYAGAASAVGPDGRRYMHLFVK